MCLACDQGMSPALSRDLVQAADLAPKASCEQLSQEDWARLHGQWRGWLERLASGSFQARACSTSEHTSVLRLGEGRDFGSCMEAVDSYYRDRQVGGMSRGLGFMELQGLWHCVPHLAMGRGLRLKAHRTVNAATGVAIVLAADALNVVGSGPHWPDQGLKVCWQHVSASVH